MIISGYETPVVYGRQQIFDPTMAKMVLEAQEQYNNALKSEYERGLKDLDNFYKTYGDFMSPFAKDMDRYSKMVGGIRGALNEAYANGVNLLGSPEGRMFISRLTNEIDPAEFNNMRANAKLGYAYLDAIQTAKAKNEFNQDFENWSLRKENGGPGLFQDFSSEGGAVWNRRGPYTYQDLNQFTGHIFDNMKDSYIGTGADHYDYYGVSREDRAKALTQHLNGLLNSSLGQYHYQNSKAFYEKMLGRELSDKEAMGYWQNDILDATTEFEHRNRKLNEMWKLQQEDASRQRAARASNPALTTGNQQSIAEVIRRTSSTRIVGQQTQEYSAKTLAEQRDKQIQIGKDVSKATGGKSSTYKGRQMFKQAYQDSNYSASVLTDFIVNQGFERADDEPNTVIVKKHQFDRLATLADIASNTAGYRGARFNSKPQLQKILNGADEIRVTFTGGNYGAYMKNATNQNHFECIVKAGKKEYNEDGAYRYNWRQLNRNESVYFDSHITSQPDDPRAGYLGTRGKDGKITDTPNIPVTNTQDTKYQDAVESDVYTTAPYLKGSDYRYDAIYTELPGYPYTPNTSVKQ